MYDFRKKIGIVNQDVFLFADTIYNNITLWDSSIGFRDVVSAAKRIGVHDFIDSLPGKYDFNVNPEVNFEFEFGLKKVCISAGHVCLTENSDHVLKHAILLVFGEET